MLSLDAFFDLLRSLAAFGVMGLCAFGAGRPLVRRLAVVEHEPLGVAVWSLALGLLSVGSLLLFIAAVGLFYLPVIAAVMALGVLLAVAELACVYLGRVGSWVWSAGRPCEPPCVTAGPTLATKLALALAAFVLLTSFVMSLAPPTSPEALSGSLECSKNLLWNHGLGSPHSLAGPAVNLVRIWFACGLALDGPVAANLLQWGLGLVLALAVTLLARTMLDRDLAWLAGSLVLLCPGVQYQLSVPIEDLALALFAALAAGAASRVVVQLESENWPLAAGLMLGAAVAVTPAAATFAIAVMAVWLHAGRGQDEPRPERARAALWALAVGLVTAAPWLLLSPRGAGGPPQSWPSVLAHLGPLLFLGMVGSLFARRLRGLSMLLGLLAVYGILLLAGQGAGRMWSPILPLAAVIAAWVWHETGRWHARARLAAAGVLCVLALAGPLARLPIVADSLAVAAGWQRRDDYLAGREPTYRAALVLNRISGPLDRLLCQDARAFYFACPTASLPENSWPSASSRPGDSQDELVGFARQHGFSYLLLAEPIDAASNPADPLSPPRHAGAPATATADEFSSAGQVLPILDYRLADDNNRYIRYRLLRLR